MTTLASGRADLGNGHVTQFNAIRSEWIKLRSLRSTWWSFLATFVIIVGCRRSSKSGPVALFEK